MTNKLALAAGGYVVLLALFLLVGRYFGALDSLRGQEVPATLSLALLLAPYWFLGFGVGERLRMVLHSPWRRIAANAALIIPYLVFVLPLNAFRWDMFVSLLGVLVSLGVVLELSPDSRVKGGWPDILALAILAFAVELPFFRDAWPRPGLSGVSKLLFVDAGLFGYLVVRPIEGVGYSLAPRWADFTVGLREFLFYTPIALTLGLSLGFLHLHGVGFPVVQFGAGWLFTLLFVALPEEVFFRGLMLNLLERRLGTRGALIVSSLLFGLAHFPKRAVFNWRYVILAAIAGFFYGRAWLAKRRVLTSGVTHATVDAVWSVWFR